MLLDPQEMLHIDLHVCNLTLRTCRRLMDHHLGIGQCQALSLCARREQERTHTGSHTDTDGGHLAFYILHSVINCHTSRNATAGRIDIHLDLFVRILRLQIQQLCHNQAGCGIVHLFTQEYNAVIQQPGKYIVGSFAAAGLLNNIRN